jgi:hypothetical protein
MIFVFLIQGFDSAKRKRESLMGNKAKIVNFESYFHFNYSLFLIFFVSEIKYDPFSDTSLRSHLGFVHGIHEYLFPSQLKRKYSTRPKSAIPVEL